MEAGKSGTPEQGNRLKAMRTVLVVLVIALALVIWIATQDNGDSGSSGTSTTAPRIVSPDELRQAGADADNAIYWAGEMDGTELELNELSSGGAQVRYLPQGAEVGAQNAGALTVGTYPLADPTAQLDGYAARPGAIVKRAKDGREVVSNSDSPTSVYFVSADNSVQIEVYDPSPKRAMSIALSGDVRPAG